MPVLPDALAASIRPATATMPVSVAASGAVAYWPGERCAADDVHAGSIAAVSSRRPRFDPKRTARRFLQTIGRSRLAGRRPALSKIWIFDSAGGATAARTPAVRAGIQAGTRTASASSTPRLAKANTTSPRRRSTVRRRSHWVRERLTKRAVGWLARRPHGRARMDRPPDASDLAGRAGRQASLPLVDRRFRQIRHSGIARRPLARGLCQSRRHVRRVRCARSPSAAACSEWRRPIRPATFAGRRKRSRSPSLRDSTLITLAYDERDGRLVPLQRNRHRHPAPRSILFGVTRDGAPVPRRRSAASSRYPSPAFASSSTASRRCPEDSMIGLQNSINTPATGSNGNKLSIGSNARRVVVFTKELFGR